MKNRNVKQSSRNVIDTKGTPKKNIRQDDNDQSVLLVKKKKTVNNEDLDQIY